MDTRKPVDGSAVLLIMVLCATWGMQQVVLKATAADIAPVMQIALRSGVAALLVGLVMWWRGESMSLRDGTLVPGLAVGVFFATEFLLVAEGLRHTSASHMVVFLYTAPIFAALGLHWRIPAERLSGLQWSGIAIAFAGIAMTFLGRGHGAATGAAAAGSTLWGDFLGVLAAIAWAATTVVVRCSSLAKAQPSKTLQYQLVMAFGVLLCAAWSSGQAQVNFTPQVWASLAFHAVVVSFASFLAWFWLLRHYLASRLGVFSFMTPLFGMLFGAWLLDEPIEAGFLVGAIPVLVGIVLVSAGPFKARAR
ncbi:MAG: DMT family transporter [Rhodoferax sp.]|uniref:DMT family transporter n=1 Tax=Rhodoferax sp. TaxID=50421 RepID=UPI002ACE5E6A|nr:DMT family transporter [Rhodoferax sp.]MDZ7890529.1 DMT family transporter [Rhodoferax sp.]